MEIENINIQIVYLLLINDIISVPLINKLFLDSSINDDDQSIIYSDLCTLNEKLEIIKSICIYIDRINGESLNTLIRFSVHYLKYKLKIIKWSECLMEFANESERLQSWHDISFFLNEYNLLFESNYSRDVEEKQSSRIESEFGEDYKFLLKTYNGILKYKET